MKAILKIDKRAAESDEVICIPQKNYNLDIGFPSGSNTVFSAGWNIRKEEVSSKRAVEVRLEVDIFFETSLGFNTQRGGGPKLDHAPLNFYGAKPSDQIPSNQIVIALKFICTHFIFSALDKN